MLKRRLIGEYCAVDIGFHDVISHIGSHEEGQRLSKDVFFGDGTCSCCGIPERERGLIKLEATIHLIPRLYNPGRFG